MVASDAVGPEGDGRRLRRVAVLRILLQPDYESRSGWRLINERDERSARPLGFCQD